MNEDFATKIWSDNQRGFSNNIGSAVRAIMDAMNVLHAKQYEAPWNRPAPRSDCESC